MDTCKVGEREREKESARERAREECRDCVLSTLATRKLHLPPLLFHLPPPSHTSILHQRWELLEHHSLTVAPRGNQSVWGSNDHSQKPERFSSLKYAHHKHAPTRPWAFTHDTTHSHPKQSARFSNHHMCVVAVLKTTFSLWWGTPQASHGASTVLQAVRAGRPIVSGKGHPPFSALEPLAASPTDTTR